MEVSAFFFSLILILLSARILGEIAAWLAIPSVMGELLAGVLLGPSLLGWVEPTEVLRMLAEIGLIFMLFEVGLETNILNLVNRGKSASLVAVGGFIAPLAGGFALAYWIFDLSLIVSLFIGGALTATSIGVTVRILRDLGRQQSHEAQIVLGAAVLDDILGVVLLALLFEFSTRGGVSFINASKVLIFVVIFMLLAPVIAKLMADMIGRYSKISKIEGLIPTMVVILVLFFAWLAHVVSAPVLLGGFASGLALSRHFSLPFGAAWQRDDGHFVQSIEHKMQPIIHLFTPIFFVMVGLSLDLQKVDWTSSFVWEMSLILILLAILSKLAGAFLIKESTPFRWAIGLSMIPRAEVGLIFAELGRTSGVFNDDLYAVMILTIAVTTVLPPFMLKWFYGRYGHHL